MTTVDTLVEIYLSRLEAAAVRLPPDRREELLGEIREHIDGARAAGAAADEAAVRTLLDRLGEPEEIVASAAEDAPAYSGVPYGGTYGGRSSYGSPSQDSPYGYGPHVWPHAAVHVPPSTALETAAVLMLTVGSLLPVIGWLVGVALLCSSRRWRFGEKVLGILVIPGGPGLLLYLGAFVPARTCGGSSGSSIAVQAVPLDGNQPFPAPSFTAEPPVLTSTESCSGGLGLPGWLNVLLLIAGLVGPVLVAVLLLRRARARAAIESPREARPTAGTWGGLEIAAVLLIGLGSFVIPVAGTVAGLVCLFLSTRWTSREKTVATMLAIIPAVLGLLIVISFLTVARS